MGNINSIINPGGGGRQGGGGGEVIFTPSSIRALGGKVAALAPMLEKMTSSLEEADVEAGAFSGCGFALANTYLQVQTFGKNDVKSKSSQLDAMAEKLKSTAQTWEQAEQASTVRPQK